MFRWYPSLMTRLQLPSAPTARLGATSWVAVLAIASIAACDAAAAAEDASVIASAESVRDFMIQNVCLDRTGKIVIGLSPIEGDPRCVAQRDVRPGEYLPYHKHDHPSPEDHAAAPRGYQRHDSFPVATAQFGAVVEHSFDFGAGDGRRFGVFDSGSDGGDIAILSPDAAAIGATEDGGGGFQLFVGAPCDGNVTAAALTHSWIIALLDPASAAPLQGETTAQLNDLKQGRQETCPSHLNAAHTRWYVRPVHYRTAAGQGRPVTLATLISEHYGGRLPETADHVERFYFTRELGGTRWERWQNTAGNRIADAESIRNAAGLAASGRCSPAETPAGGAPLLMVDCREWTLIDRPDDAEGDRPGFFIDALRSRPGPSFFAP